MLVVQSNINEILKQEGKLSKNKSLQNFKLLNRQFLLEFLTPTGAKGVTVTLNLSQEFTDHLYFGWTRVALLGYSYVKVS